MLSVAFCSHPAHIHTRTYNLSFWYYGGKKAIPAACLCGVLDIAQGDICVFKR